MPLQGSLSIERMCELARVSRASFYRSFHQQRPVEEELDVRSAIQQIAVEHRRRYGYRRISAELRRRGMQVNHKRVMRIMAEDNLLAVQPKSFVVTTNSSHEFEVYLNLASRMKMTGINQLWVADITYIRLQREFVFLAVILDGFSRKVVGWELDRTLAVRLPLTALEQAIAERKPGPGLVHHSDRGLQYAATEYVEVLLKHQVIPSMSRPANPYDNASCESFIKTLKREEIYANRYEDLGHMRVNIEGFIEQYLQSVAVAFGVGLPFSRRVRRKEWSPGGGCNHHGRKAGVLPELMVDGCAKTGDAVGRASWRSSFLDAPSAGFFCGKQGMGERSTSARKNFPSTLGRTKENSSYGKCAQENCLTVGVHVILVCPILCPP